jgi:hypothetical protein
VASLDLVDETFLVVDREQLAGIVADPRRWQQWWPDLALAVFMDRGAQGIRWSVSGAWTGSLEVWLEPVGDGVLLHHYARLDPAPRGGGAVTLSPRRIDRERRLRARAWKQHVFALKDELERGRAPGTPRLQQVPDAGPG